MGFFVISTLSLSIMIGTLITITIFIHLLNMGSSLN